MSHHDPFKALAPVEWSAVAEREQAGSLADFVQSVFADAMTLVASIPDSSASSSAPPASSGGRARAATESAVGPAMADLGSSVEDEKVVVQLRKEWKEAKISPKENPHGIAVHKLAAKDGRGAWFARRSLHNDGLGFDRWKTGLEREFPEMLRRVADVDGKVDPGTGNIRGIGAEKRVEDVKIGKEGLDGKVQVYQLSAQFPGPTSPRDFITLLLISDGSSNDSKSRRPRRPRHFMVVSKPVTHPECPQRQGYIRGQYESVEIIREVPISKPLRRVRSSVDVTREDYVKTSGSDGISKDALLRAANAASGNGDQHGAGPKSISFARQAVSDIGAEDTEEVEMAIEWLMITRSDPGGSVPRFMVEKGTPPGIVSDAGKFMKWMSSSSFDEDDEKTKAPATISEEAPPPLPVRKSASIAEREPAVPEEPEPPKTGSGGIYSIVTGALGAAGSAVATVLPGTKAGSVRATDTDGITEEEESDISSEGSYASAEEGDETPMPMGDPLSKNTTSSALSMGSNISDSSTAPLSRHEKELRKLDDRRRRAHEKLARFQEKNAARKRSDSTPDDAAAKLKEKHDREVARQEDKFKREMRKLEERRVADEKKAEDKRRKNIEKEEKANVVAELEKVRTERDVANKQIEILKSQVGELQAQNTMLVTKLGKIGPLELPSQGGSAS